MSYLLPITLKRFNTVDWKNFQAFIEESIDGAEAAVSKLSTQREVLRATTERTENVLSQYFQYEYDFRCPFVSDYDVNSSLGICCTAILSIFQVLTKSLRNSDFPPPNLQTFGTNPALRS